jgi:predicted metal-dependent peptidase
VTGHSHEGTTEPCVVTSPADGALRVAAARALAAERMPYLATALFACTPIRSDGVPTLAVDARWRFYWNPSWCGAVSVPELAGGWLHEVGHLLREHVDRFAELGEPPELAPLFNVAGDAAINADLRDNGVPLPPGAVHVEHIPGAERGMTAEQMYALLRPSAGQSTVDCGSGATPGTRPWEIAVAQTEAERGIDPEHGDRVRRQTAADVRASGLAPAGLRRWAEEILTPRVDWRTELNAVVRRKAAEVAGVRDYTYARPARRTVPGVILPAMRQPRPPVVYAVVDTSSSMDAHRLARCLTEIDGIVRRSGRLRTSVRVVSCDTATGEFHPVRSVDDVVLTGGGGTDLRVGIAAVARARPRADLVVVLTDGDTPWSPTAPADNPGARYVAVLVRGDRATPPWLRKIVVDDP